MCRPPARVQRPAQQSSAEVGTKPSRIRLVGFAILIFADWANALLKMPISPGLHSPVMPCQWSTFGGGDDPCTAIANVVI
jgi:hypothetical protein